MEQMESLQKVNRQQRLAEWSRRVEACRNSGLTVVQWCREHGIAVRSCFSSSSNALITASCSSDVSILSIN